MSSYKYDLNANLVIFCIITAVYLCFLMFLRIIPIRKVIKSKGGGVKYLPFAFYMNFVKNGVEMMRV